jgi:predicted Zn finger-like uncharacterized protein
MIITCPHCRTKYQVTYDAIGSAGRKVQCAHCQQAWQQAPLEASPPPVADPVVDAFDEDMLDEAMNAAASAAAEQGDARGDRRVPPSTAAKAQASQSSGGSDAAALRKQQRAFSRRQDAIEAQLPLAKFRRLARLLAFVALCSLLGVLYFARVEVVTRYPDLAGVYERLGLAVNVVGLDFAEVQTLRTLRDGKDMLTVSAQLVGLTPEPVPVPAVVVTLLDDHGAALYEWSLDPSVPDLMAGERTTFDTQLIMPPEQAVRVRLSFAGQAGSLGAGSGSGALPPPEPLEHPEEAAEHERSPAAPEEHSAPEHH